MRKNVVFFITMLALILIFSACFEKYETVTKSHLAEKENEQMLTESIQCNNINRTPIDDTNNKLIETFTLRSASATENSALYFTLKPDNTLAATSKSEEASLFELYTYSDGTSAIRCLTNGKYLSFKNYKSEYQYVIMADADTVNWNERFKVYEDENGYKYITSHFTNHRDEANRNNLYRRVSLTTYKGQDNTLSLFDVKPASLTDLFVFTEVQPPIQTLKVSSKTSGNGVELNWDLPEGFNDSNNYVVKVSTDSEKITANTPILIKDNKASAIVSNLNAGKEYTLEVDLLDNSGNAITSKEIPVRIFNHPGLLHSEEELEALKYHIDNKTEPWYSAWLALNNRQSMSGNLLSLDFKTVARAGIGRGSTPDSGHEGDLQKGVMAAYLDAMQWVATGDTRYADKAVEIVNAWAYTLKVLDGNDNILGAGNLYKLINVAEILRYYKGGYINYKDEDFKKLQDMLITVVYPVIQDFGVPSSANGNWDAAAYVTMASMGVLCDNAQIFNRAIAYYKNGFGTGSIKNYIIDSGQTQESGRDQGHTQFGIGLMAETCEIAWNQKIDLYGLENNRLLKAFEYTAKYNLFNDDVPFQPIPNVYGKTDSWSYWPDRLDQQKNNRGELQPFYELPLSHYKERMGLSCEWTEKAAKVMRPAGYDTFGTLIHYNGPSINVPSSHIFKLRTRQADKYEATLTKMPNGSYATETIESYFDLQPDNTLTITSKRINAPYFELQNLEDGTYAVKCLENNKYLSVKPEDQYVIKADANTIGKNEKFKLQQNNSGYYGLTFPGLNNRRMSLVDNYMGYGYSTYKGSNDTITTDDKYLTLSLNAATPAKDTDMLIPIYDTESLNTTAVK